MLTQRISVQPLAELDIPQIITLMQAQSTRLDTLDPRLRLTRPRKELTYMLQAQLSIQQNRPLVAHDAEGYVRGYVFPNTWELPADDEMLSFFSRRNGTYQFLTLPAPAERDALPVASALLDALNTYWKEQRTDGDLLRWPNCDLWPEALFLEKGFRADSYVALHPNTPLIPSKQQTAEQFHARPARPGDEEALVRLHHEELAFHVPYTPFVRLIPALERNFRARLAQIWEGKRVEQGAPIVLVVECAGEVVALAENELLIEEDYGGFGFLPPGRFGYINNVAVRADMRGQGVGHMLVEAVFAAFEPYKVDNYMLWFTKDNPLSSKFWPHLGFEPLWLTYQRRTTTR